MQLRADFLVEQELVERRGRCVILACNLLGTLRNRKLAQTAKDIASTGLELPGHFMTGTGFAYLTHGLNRSLGSPVPSRAARYALSSSALRFQPTMVAAASTVCAQVQRLANSMPGTSKVPPRLM